MSDFISQVFVVLTSGGILLWAGKLLLQKSLEQKLKVEADKINLVRHHDLEYRKAQIQYLYGPLYGILKTNRKVYDLWMAGELNEINLKVKQLFKENNEKANKIIVDNAHLIDESPMPDGFIRYTTSSKIWSMYCSDSEEGSLPNSLAEHPDVKWCQEFEDYIFEKYERLSKELNGLYARYGVK